ncbi:CAP domain-containing protein [Bordetella tumbae]|uniref:hypothetical protein n=1 Tax=Bordetella tumbae TaxID=1649139 RepID=UPI0039F14291
MSIASFVRLSGCLAASGLIMSASLAATSAEDAVRQDIAAMMTGQKNQTDIDRTDRGVFLETRHCLDGKQSLMETMRGQLRVDQEDALLALFQRVLCARSDDGMGKLAVARFGDDVADPFQTGLAMYSGMLELGEWPIDWSDSGIGKSPRSEAFVSMLGLSADSPLSAVSRWEVLSPSHVRVWFGQFRQAPSDTMTYDFELRGKRWVWTSAVASTRL